MASTSKGAKSALIEWIGADFKETGAQEDPDKCAQVQHHINYTINNTTITDSFSADKGRNEQGYVKQMRKDLIASGRYQL